MPPPNHSLDIDRYNQHPANKQKPDIGTIITSQYQQATSRKPNVPNQQQVNQQAETDLKDGLDGLDINIEELSAIERDIIDKDEIDSDPDKITESKPVELTPEKAYQKAVKKLGQENYDYVSDLAIKDLNNIKRIADVPIIGQALGKKLIEWNAAKTPEEAGELAEAIIKSVEFYEPPIDENAKQHLETEKEQIRKRAEAIESAVINMQNQFNIDSESRFDNVKQIIEAGTEAVDEFNSDIKRDVVARTEMLVGDTSLVNTAIHLMGDDEHIRKHGLLMRDILKYGFTASGVKHKISRITGQVLVEGINKAGKKVWKLPEETHWYSTLGYEEGVIGGSIGGFGAGSAVAWAIPGVGWIGGGAIALMGAIGGATAGKQWDISEALTFNNYSTPIDKDIEDRVREIGNRNTFIEEILFPPIAAAGIKAVTIGGKKIYKTFGSALGYNTTGLRKLVTERLIQEKIAAKGNKPLTIEMNRQFVKEANEEVDLYLTAAHRGIDTQEVKDVFNVLGFSVKSPLAKIPDDWFLAQHRTLKDIADSLKDDISSQTRGNQVAKFHAAHYKHFVDLANEGAKNSEINASKILKDVNTLMHVSAETRQKVLGVVLRSGGFDDSISDEGVKRIASVLENSAKTGMSNKRLYNLIRSNTLEKGSQLNPIRVMHLVRQSNLSQGAKDEILNNIRKDILYNDDIAKPGSDLRKAYELMDTQDELFYNTHLSGAAEAISESITKFMHNSNDSNFKNVLNQLLNDTGSDSYGVKNIIYSALVSRLKTMGKAGDDVITNFESKLLGKIFERNNLKIAAGKMDAFNYKSLIDDLDNIELYSKQGKELKDRIMQAQNAYSNMDIKTITDVMERQREWKGGGLRLGLDRIMFWFMANNIDRLRVSIFDSLTGKKGKERSIVRGGLNVLGANNPKINIKLDSNYTDPLNISRLADSDEVNSLTDLLIKNKMLPEGTKIKDGVHLETVLRARLHHDNTYVPMAVYNNIGDNSVSNYSKYIGDSNVGNLKRNPNKIVSVPRDRISYYRQGDNTTQDNLRINEASKRSSGIYAIQRQDGSFILRNTKDGSFSLDEINNSNQVELPINCGIAGKKSVSNKDRISAPKDKIVNELLDRY